MRIPDRAQAFDLLCEYTKREALIRHGLSVEAAMRFYATRFGEDAEFWGVVGLLHDFDYEKYPSLDDHPFKGAEILRRLGYDELLITSILAHAPHTQVPHDTLLKKTLFAVDELCGFVTAVTLVRPSRQIAEVKVKSVKKKMKDKGFARNVSREDIHEGSELLGIDLDEHIANVVEAMRGISAELGL